jgi:putative transposase
VDTRIWSDRHDLDDTKLDNLLVDADDKMVGCVWITSVIDSYSSCIMGYYLSLMSAGSHEVALAWRHVILPKQYGAEYELLKEWEVCGLPEYIVTDCTKEFKSGHLRRVAMELGFKLRLRLHKEQGGIVERLAGYLNTKIAYPPLKISHSTSAASSSPRFST